MLKFMTGVDPYIDKEVTIIETEKKFVIVEDQSERNVLNTILGWDGRRPIHVHKDDMERETRDYVFTLAWECEAVEDIDHIEFDYFNE